MFDTGPTPADKATMTYDRLTALHGSEEHVPRRDPMHELVSTMLSHRTTEANEARAFQAMWDRYGSWEAIRDADADDLGRTISAATFPEPKAARIQEALGIIINERGEVSIDFLADIPAAEGLKWLMRLPGVGVKTASLVLLFNFKKRVLPVDTHVHRVSLRVGLIPEKTSASKAHDRLPELLPDDAYVLFNFHKALLKHGQRICKWSDPHCGQCPLVDFSTLR